MEKKSIGSFMAALRKSNGMTQQEVADRLNVSNKTVSKWERDESFPEITLIPVIAELFNVTSDEILRGERIVKDDITLEKPDVKVEKQKKRIISSSITRFNTISYVAMALALLGLICLFTVAYGFYKSVLAFGIFLVFILSSVVLELILMNITNTSLHNKDLFEEEEELLKPLQRNKVKFSSIVFTVDSIAVIFALPIVAVRSSYYLNSVITIDSYLSLIPMLTILSLITARIIHQIAYNKINSFAGNDIGDAFPKSKMLCMNLIHTGFSILMFCGLSFGTFKETVVYPQRHLLILSIASMVISTIVFALTSKEGRDKLILAIAGIRNLILGFAGIILVLWLYFSYIKQSYSVRAYPSVFLFVFVIGILLLYDVIKKRLFIQPK